MYFEGKGCDLDYEKAFEMFQLSASQGRVEAQNSLGIPTRYLFFLLALFVPRYYV
jgi:TPR repeat protein